MVGWLGQLAKHRNTPIVGDHDLWPYFSRRVGFSVVGYFEPEPGVPPATKHLRILIDQMKAESVSIIFSAPYFDERHARFVSENTGAAELVIENKCGFVVPIRNPKAIADKLTLLTDNKTLLDELSDNTHKTALKRTWEKP